jgi:threonine synthase
MLLRCITCGNPESPDGVAYRCSKCGDPLEIVIDTKRVREAVRSGIWSRRPISVWRYKEALPIRDESKIVTLAEGGTHLHRCDRLAERLGLRTLYVKNEGENPTGSFKDRGMTVGVTRAAELGARTLMCASTGNTSASLAAYSAKAGVRCVVLVPAGNVAQGKMAQAIAHGAQILQVRGNFDAAMGLVQQLSLVHPEIYLLNSINPFRIEGQKTAAYEIVDQLGGGTPDRVIIPVGNAGNITAYWKGFNELLDLGVPITLPKMTGVQARGASPIARAIMEGKDRIVPEDRPETVATAIRIGSPVNWKRAIRAIRESGGTAEAVSDEEILESQRLLARLEGIFVEPASASSIAGLSKLLADGKVDRGETVVCVTTGHGLKDPEAASRGFVAQVIDASVESIEHALGLAQVVAGRSSSGGV